MVQLEKMETVLREADYTAHVQKLPGQSDICLEVNYGEDEAGRDRLLQIFLIPSSEAGSTATQFVKFAVKLPFQAPADRLSEIARAVTIVNEELAIGHFGMDLEGNLHYQYSLALDQDAPIAGKVLIELLALIEFQQEHFGDYLEGVCDGEVSVAVLHKVIQQTSP